MVTRPNPKQIDLDDLVGHKVVQVAHVNDRFDDDTLLGILDDEGRVWLSPTNNPEQEDRAFIQLGLWIQEDAVQYRAEKDAALQKRTAEIREQRERQLYEELRKKFDT